MAKLSVEQALTKAKSHIKKGEVAEAQTLYATILKAFPNNKKAQQGLTALGGSQGSAAEQGPPQVVIDQLMSLYKQGQLKLVVDQAQDLTVQFPKAITLWNMLGASSAQLGKFDQAIGAFKEIISLNPNQASSYYNLGNALKDQGKLEEAIEAYAKTLELKPDYEMAYNNIVVALNSQGQSGEKRQKAVMENYNKALKIKAENADEQFEMALELQKQGKFDEAVGAYKKVISLWPDYADVYLNMGVALKDQGKLEEAIEAYSKALAIKPDYAEAYYNMGAALQEHGKLEKAIEAYNKALSIKPDYADAYSNMGVTLSDQGKLEEAIEAYSKALAIKPDYAEAHNNMGVALKDQGKLEEAIEAHNKALAIKPDYAEAHSNIGVALQEHGKLEKAIEAYNKALSIKPDYADAYSNMGVTLSDQGKLEEAIEAYSKALAIKPDYAEAHYNMGNALKDQDKLEKAIEAYSKALAIKPDYEAARVAKLHQQAHICNWTGIVEDHALVPELGTTKKHVSPFALLSMEDAPERHRTRSEIYVKAKYPQKPLPLPTKPLKKPERLRIGYFSTDFKVHPVAYLIAKVLEQHSREQFEVFGYSLHGSSHCYMRKRLISAFDHFTDVQDMSDKDVAFRVRQDDIDIAIDLNGYTKGNRTGVFAYRAAPIQINYLGYPGTMGADFIDYIVSDQNLVPFECQHYFSEKQLYLPDTYMPTDNERKLSKVSLSRKEVGLPDGVFVFCCFNNNYKITDIEFDIWMRLLGEVEESVLWLRRSNEISDIMIRKEADKRGISPSRIVFAERVPMDEHLSRHQLADLFIDTFTFNAHTTATEALWAGLPVVTKQGKGFATRVAGSLLKAVGLPELVAKTEQDYESLILDLATNPSKLIKIKEKLAANRLSKPLFDTEQYTKHLEDGYQQAYQNYFDGKAAQTIIVKK